MTNIVNAVFQKRNPLNTHSECESANFIRVIAAHLQYAGMNHAAAENFEPSALLAHPAAMSAALHASHVHLSARLREREEARAQADLCLLAEDLLHELKQGALQIAHANIFINNQSFNLVELEGMCRIIIIAAVYFAGR